MHFSISLLPFVSLLAVGSLASVPSPNGQHPLIRSQPDAVPAQAQAYPQPQPQPQHQFRSSQPLPPQVQPLMPRPQSQPQSNFYSRGYHKVTTYPDQKTRYLHTYNSDSNGRYGYRSWVNPDRTPVYAPRSPYPNQNELGTVQPSYQPAPPPPFSEFNTPRAQGDVSSNAISSYNRQRSVSEVGLRRNGHELSSPSVLVQPTNQPIVENLESLLSLIKSASFLKHANELGSQKLFLSKIVGPHKSADEALIRNNTARTGLSFSQEDCQPRPTLVKFGSIDKPEILFNPSSVEVPRCSQGCFSWQFDCIPTARAAHTVSVAVYTSSANETKREIFDFSIEYHKACACSCQSLAGCFGSATLSTKRLPTINPQS